jgi:hypothetical protein
LKESARGEPQLLDRFKPAKLISYTTSKTA